MMRTRPAAVRTEAVRAVATLRARACRHCARLCLARRMNRVAVVVDVVAMRLQVRLRRLLGWSRLRRRIVRVGEYAERRKDDEKKRACHGDPQSSRPWKSRKFSTLLGPLREQTSMPCRDARQTNPAQSVACSWIVLPGIAQYGNCNQQAAGSPPAAPATSVPAPSRIRLAAALRRKKAADAAFFLADDASCAAIPSSPADTTRH